MTEMFTTLGNWNWMIFGVILMGLEVLAPGIFLFWLGLAALLVGLITFVVHPSWQVEILLFAAFAIAAVPLWRRLARGDAGGSESNPFLNRRCLARPCVHAGEADHRRRGDGADRRHGLARRRSGYAGRHAREDRTGQWRRSDGGGGVRQRARPPLLRGRGVSAPALGEGRQCPRPGK